MRGVRTVIVPAAIAAATAALLLPATLAAQAQQVPTLRVTPRSGTVRTTFTVHFKAPVASGTDGSTFHSYELSATGPKGAAHCVDQVNMSPVATSAGEAMAVHLKPAQFGGTWCVGKYTGEVLETSRPQCGPPVASADGDFIICPQVEPNPRFLMVASELGKFSFRVKS